MATKYILVTFLFIMLQGRVDSVGTTTATAASSAAEYWKMKLPNTSLPALLDYMLPPSSGFFNHEKRRLSLNKNAPVKMYSYNYDQRTDESQLNSKMFRSLFLLEEDLLNPIFEREMRFLSLADSGPRFMSRDEMKAKVPFGSRTLSQVMSTFSISPTSLDAQLMNSTVASCEHSGPHLCVPSMEDMADYVSHQFPSSNVEAIAVNVTPSMEVNRRYRIRGVNKLGNAQDLISCHKATFPYGVFKCHKVDGRAYKVNLESTDEKKVKVDGLVNCHDDTAAWNPEYGAFEILQLTPGDTVCHFLLGDNVVFRKN